MLPGAVLQGEVRVMLALSSPPVVAVVRDEVHSIACGPLHHAGLDVGVARHVEAIKPQVWVLQEHATPGAPDKQTVWERGSMGTE